MKGIHSTKGATLCLPLLKVVTVTPQTPAGTTFKSMIQTVSMECPMPTMNPLTTARKKVNSTSVSAQ